MALSYLWAPLQRVAAQSITRRPAVAGFIRSTNDSQKSLCFSSFAPFKPNIITPLFISLRATLVAIIPASALPASDVLVLGSFLLFDPVIAVAALASTKKLFKLFM